MSWTEKDKEIKIKEIGPLSSVSVDGNYAITGDGYNGIVNIYKINENYEWELMVTKTGDSNDDGWGFGYSVAISGTSAIVGNPMKNDGKGEFIIYHLMITNNVEGKWGSSYSETGQKEYGKLGWSVAINGTSAIVGSPEYGISGPTAKEGKVFFYRINTSLGGWEKSLKDFSGENEGDNFGWSVGISGTLAIVGALKYGSGDLEKSGKVYFYEDLGYTWAQTFSINGYRKNGAFGSSVAIDVNSAIVGAQNYDTVAGSDKQEGKVYFYERTSNISKSESYFKEGGLDERMSWSKNHSFELGEQKNSKFGYSVWLSGTYAIVGAPDYTIDPDSDSASEGKIYFYKKDRAQKYINVTEFDWRGESSFTGDKSWGRLGNSVSVMGNYAITGASEASDGNNTVRFYVGFGQPYGGRELPYTRDETIPT